MDRLIKGVLKFQSDVFPQQEGLFNELAHGQNPRALFITCADSRVSPTLFTQAEPGDLFVCRNAGNMVPAYGELHGGVSATIEYAVALLQVRHIVVCGHTDCGAINALHHPEQVEGAPAVQSWLKHGEAARAIVAANYEGNSEEELLSQLTQYNVIAQLQNLRTHPSVAARLVSRKIELHGWVYDIQHGHVSAFDSQQGRFVPLDQLKRVSSRDAELSLAE